MKIGILTFHAQLNYGALLQCFALQSYLQSLGHQVKVIDAKLAENNLSQNDILVNKSLYKWCRFLVQGSKGTGFFEHALRVIKTKQFLKNKINLTDFSFFNWQEVPEDKLSEFDLIIIGSDQIWNYNFASSLFMLEGLKSSMPAIGYAVSLGVKSIPDELKSRYKNAINRLHNLSFRESSSNDILAELLASKMAHVCDPALLLSRDEWLKYFNIQQDNKIDLFCYMIAENYNDVVPKVKQLCKQNNYKTRIFFNHNWLNCQNYLYSIRQLFTKVNECISGDPVDFIVAIANSQTIITDSFHALIFGIIFGKKVKFVLPNKGDDLRKAMFGRIEEITNNYIEEDIFYDSIDSALRSESRDMTIKNEQLNLWISDSKRWLEAAIKEGELLK